MSELNERLAEAVEVAYGVEYDPDKASTLIRTLHEWNWYVLHNDELEDMQRGDFG